MKTRVLVLLCTLVAMLRVGTARGDVQYVESTPSFGSFAIVAGEDAAPLLVSPGDWPGVLRAADDLKMDIHRVTGKTPVVAQEGKEVETALGKNVIMVGTIGKSPVIDGLVKSGKLDVKATAGKWESFIVQVVNAPMAGVDRALVIAGSDKRGTIFGIYDVSQQIGVSPWYWWADVPAIHKDNLYVKAGKYAQGEPAVKYRGIFINDEAPALTHMVYEKYGSFNHEFYAHVFELILRLRGNYLWPAMWQARTGVQEPAQGFNIDDPQNAATADMYGIVMGTSHHEPMLRSQKEWKTVGPTMGNGQWNYQQNEEGMKKFWSEGIERNKNYESIITLGMRGDGDTPIPSAGSPEATAALLEKIVADQRKIIAEKINPAVEKVPQMWCLYNEVQGLYDSGMKVPDDVTLLWCDDNWGNLRRVPTEGERKRSGGTGIYYHFDLVGSPRNYKWLNVTQVAKVWEQMTEALEFGADRIWIVNVGDIKPMEYPISFFMKLAWEGKKLGREEMAGFAKQWAAEQFGPGSAEEIGQLLTRYGQCAGRRTPEMIDAGTFSLVNYNEAERVVAEYRDIVAKGEAIAKLLPPETQDAFFELVIHQPKAMGILNELYMAQAKNQLYLAQGRASANDYAAQVRELYKTDGELVDFYHALAGGKWNHMMDQAHYGYTGFQEPRPVQIMPAVREMEVPAAGKMGVAVEGNEKAAFAGELSLPKFDVFNRQTRWFDVFNGGKADLRITIQASEPWIAVSPLRLRVAKEERFSVGIDWTKAPAGTARGKVTIKREGLDAGGAAVVVNVETFNPTEVTPDTLRGYVEAEGVVAMAPEKFSRKVDIGIGREALKWDKIQDYGRYTSGMTIFPMTAPSVVPPTAAKAPCLEYQMYLFTAGPAEVYTVLGPTLDYAGRGVRLAVSMDGEVPQVIEAVGRGQGANNLPADWTASVGNHARTVKSTHTIAAPGYHTLKVWMVDPGVVIERIVVDMGGLRASYLGPVESYRN